MKEPRGVVPWSKADDLPPNTCPTIDAAIEKMEAVRDANSELRRIALEWEEMASNYHDAALAWESYADELKDEIKELKEELNAAREATC